METCADAVVCRAQGQGPGADPLNLIRVMPAKGGIYGCSRCQGDARRRRESRGRCGYRQISGGRGRRGDRKLPQERKMRRGGRPRHPNEGGEALTYRAGITDEATVGQVVRAAADAFGAVDVLVNILVQNALPDLKFYTVALRDLAHLGWDYYLQQLGAGCPVLREGRRGGGGGGGRGGGRPRPHAPSEKTRCCPPQP